MLRTRVQLTLGRATIRPAWQPAYRGYASGGSGQSPDEKASSEKTKSKGPQPKILEHIPPSQTSDPEVKKHNEEFEQRPDRAANEINDKNEAVSKEFWKGRCPFGI